MTDHIYLRRALTSADVINNNMVFIFFIVQKNQSIFLFAFLKYLMNL